MALENVRKKLKGLFETETPKAIGIGPTYKEAKKEAEKTLPGDVEDYNEYKKFENPEGENGESHIMVLEYEEPERKGGGMSVDMVDDTLGNDDGHSPSL